MLADLEIRSDDPMGVEISQPGLYADQGNRYFRPPLSTQSCFIGGTQIQ